MEQRKRRLSDRLLVPALCLALVALIAASALSVAAMNESNKLDRQSQDIVKAELFACERVQRLRERINVANETIYRVLVAAARTTTSPLGRRAYKNFAAQMEYLPPTNCELAVNKPDHYRPAEAYPMATYVAKQKENNK